MSGAEQKKGNVKTRRGYKGKHTVENKFKIIGVNANGLSSKLQSLDHIIKALNPGVLCIQETKVRKCGKIKIDNLKKYVIFELTRKHSNGGGLATLVKPELDPVFIAEGDDQVEILVVQIRIKELHIRVINAYGPQECDSLERKSLFWARLHSEVAEAAEANCAVFLQMDGNLHCGEEIINGDPNTINSNGKLFRTFLSNNPSISLLNSLDKCQGKVTRRRKKGKKVEEAILDFALVCEKMLPFFEKMIIDEVKKYPLTSYLNGKATDSDHLTIIIDFNVKYKKQQKVREEQFNFKDLEGQEKFKNILNTENNLTRCFENNDDLEDQCESWLQEFNQICQRSFKKVRVTNKVRVTEISKLFEKRSELVQKLKAKPEDKELENELEKVVASLTEYISKDNLEKIKRNFLHLDQSEGESFANGVWKVKNKEFPKFGTSTPAAKTDVNGKLVTDPEDLKQLYLDTFTHRLRQRPVKEEYAETFQLQQNLLEKRLMITRDVKSSDWSEEDITETLKSLKNGKCKDPLGLINEIFKPPTAGSDMVQSLQLMMNSIKRQVKLPNVFRYKNISTIYKNKGSRSDLENDRGIFTCTVLNSILQKLIYKDNYDEIDSNLSDSNVGARKRKNIRNHTFVINGIIHHTVTSKSRPVDITVVDYKQCFDTLSVDVGCNDLYNVGVIDDQLNLIHECDSLSKVAVKTPVGLTKRVDVCKVVAQGEVISPLKCTVSVDSIAQAHTENLSENLYNYKGQVPIPPLGMVDDQIVVSHCGLDSALATAHLNTQTNLKKLQFGADKCHKLHVGRKCRICPENMIDTWKLEKSSDVISSVVELIDVEGHRHVIEEVQREKYLGDVIQSDGKNNLNIQERKNRGIGAVNQIKQLLDDLCLGDYHFEAANILRNSLLLSTLLSNSETWYNLTKKEISELESVDEMSLRNVLSAHSKTPTETLYLESGNIPVRFILMSRRLNFLHYILNEDKDSLLRTFFTAQRESPVRGDWVMTVTKDMEELGINLTMEEIAGMSKLRFKEMIKDRVELKAFDYLTGIKDSHSKSKNIKYEKIKLQRYLQSETKNLSINDKQFIFAARTRMLDLKGNFKTGMLDKKCRKCEQSEETQEHLLECPALCDSSLALCSPSYIDLFGDDPSNIGHILKYKFKLLKTVIPRAPTTSAATMIDIIL